MTQKCFTPLYFVAWQSRAGTRNVRGRTGTDGRQAQRHFGPLHPLLFSMPPVWATAAEFGSTLR